jgi:hypothetical protein
MRVPVVRNNFAKQRVFCELADGNFVPVTKSKDGYFFSPLLRWIRKLLRAVGSDPLNGRDVYQFYESVIAYLNWRVTSQRRKFTSWRNQPPELSDLAHAINILSQLLHSGTLYQITPEHQELKDELGRLLDEARKQARADSLPLARKAAA